MLHKNGYRKMFEQAILGHYMSTMTIVRKNRAPNGGVCQVSQQSGHYLPRYRTLNFDEFQIWADGYIIE